MSTILTYLHRARHLITILVILIILYDELELDSLHPQNQSAFLRTITITMPSITMPSASHSQRLQHHFIEPPKWWCYDDWHHLNQDNVDELLLEPWRQRILKQPSKPPLAETFTDRHTQGRFAPSSPLLERLNKERLDYVLAKTHGNGEWLLIDNRLYRRRSKYQWSFVGIRLNATAWEKEHGKTSRNGLNASSTIDAQCDRNHVEIIFLHVPKTAGSALVATFAPRRNLILRMRGVDSIRYKNSFRLFSVLSHRMRYFDMVRAICGFAIARRFNVDRTADRLWLESPLYVHLSQGGAFEGDCMRDAIAVNYTDAELFQLMKFSNRFSIEYMPSVRYNSLDMKPCAVQVVLLRDPLTRFISALRVGESNHFCPGWTACHSDMNSLLSRLHAKYVKWGTLEYNCLTPIGYSPNEVYSVTYANDVRMKHAKGDVVAAQQRRRRRVEVAIERVKASGIIMIQEKVGIVVLERLNLLRYYTAWAFNGGGEHYSVGALSDESREKVNEMVEGDRLIYEAAVQKFDSLWENMTAVLSAHSVRSTAFDCTHELGDAFDTLDNDDKLVKSDSVDELIRYCAPPPEVDAGPSVSNMSSMSMSGNAHHSFLSNVHCYLHFNTIYGINTSSSSLPWLLNASIPYSEVGNLYAHIEWCKRPKAFICAHRHGCHRCQSFASIK